MSSYIHQLILSDGDAIMLKAALKMYIAHCDEQMPDGAAKAPFYAHKKYAENVLSRLYGNSKQVSGNNFS